MSDTRRMVDTIVSALHSSDLTVDGPLRDTAQQYADACKSANERLSQCEQLLRQGLRDEALRQAELDPDLLELAAELDFPERELWDERMMLNDLSAPPPINRRAVEQISRAYAEKAPLAELLKQHRLLALARAPLPERLSVVRLLAKAEPTNPAWGDDVTGYELARLEEMHAELKQIRQTSNWLRMQQLNADATGPGWSTFLPLDLVSDIEKEYKRQARLDAEKQLKQYHAMLKQAVDRVDLNKAKRIQEKVNRLCEGRMINSGEALLKPFAGYFDWIAEQERLAKEQRRFEKACNDLADAISQNADPTILAEFYQAIVDFRRGVPPEIEFKYRDHLRRTGRSNTLKIILFLAAMVLMFGCLSGIVGLIVVLSR